MGTTPLPLELSPIYPLFIPKSFTDTPLYPQPRPTKNAVKRHVSPHCPPRGALMPFGTSTKERLCTEMNNYPQNANIRHHFLVICKRIHKLRRGWTTSVDNPVENVQNSCVPRWISTLLSTETGGIYGKYGWSCRILGGGDKVFHRRSKYLLPSVAY